MNLDIEFPQGDPGAVTCRLCSSGKRRHVGVLICPTCDMVPEPAL